MISVMQKTKRWGERWGARTRAILAGQIKGKYFKTPLATALEGSAVELVFQSPWDLDGEFNHSARPDPA